MRSFEYNDALLKGGTGSLLPVFNICVQGITGRQATRATRARWLVALGFALFAWQIVSSMLLAVEPTEKAKIPPAEAKPSEPEPAAPELNEAERHFAEKVKPLLDSRCVACHGTEKGEGGLRLDNRKAALAGGDSGPSLIVGKPAESLLVKAVNHAHLDLKMPPKEKLTKKDVEALERWIRDGAPWPQVRAKPNSSAASPGERIGDAWTDPRNPIVKIFAGQRLDLWSLKPRQTPPVPEVKHADWPKGDLDRFILARFETDGVEPPPTADPRTLARRLYYDLTGLPPTPEQAAEFAKAVETNGGDAVVAALVDQLLASPRFGEHFARLWLDVIRYSDSNGFDWDEFRPQAWRFRDYAIRSFNADKPFDQFTREQLAGDELLDGPPKTAAEQDLLIATGYLRMGPHDNAAGLFDEQDRSRAELMADLTETTAGAFLGLTFNCCRCHDHKYDPLSHADHYRLRAFFAPVKFADDLPLELAVEQAEINRHNEKYDTELKPLRAQLEALPKDEKEKKEEREKLKKEIEKLEKQRRKHTHGLLMIDKTDDIAKIHVLFQGDHKAPRDEVEPGFLSILDPQPAALAKSQNAQTTGRRLALANWIVAPENPLTARVFVNRVWLAMLGKPLVATPNDFGLAGERPADAALLDWLAGEFIRQEWSVKQLVRMIAVSAVYRQQASFAKDHFALRSPRRLTAEQLRDAILFTSGLLTTKADGPPIWPELPQDVLNSNPAFLDDNAEKTKGWYPSPKEEQYARSVFLIQKRNTRVPLLETFDLPDNSTPCARRNVSTVAPQALSLLNSALATDAARAFAERIKKTAVEDHSEQVRAAFRLALQRAPDEAEAAACGRLLTERSLVELCRALLNLNEFVYVD